ncbi:winged helix-turn-helix domain-containing protein [Luteimonas sp. BDR2-5]|uniref:winged helix-turn-helix domain-containing protein n=1 Tax=Proluteimonas luteida TaxID=2878685 RepID=UPI001E4ADF75|nr:winged helix-turn-helix domain-containing protein [Luteimonas sp. BDR2-5]MCD9029671.1 winged helix-turn-helix domain-containing protein [Luteimonas sp. BDR2-5]
MREIEMPGARGSRRVTPKAMMVLRLLVDAQGRVVSRTELLARAWPDTLPTDDVLTQAVTQLRKAFGAGTVGAAEGRRYIETIAKTGYRLTVPVEVLEHADIDVPMSASAPPAVEEAGLVAAVPGDSRSAPEPRAATVTEASAATLPQTAAPRRRDRLLLGTTAALLLAVMVVGVMVAALHAPTRSQTGLVAAVSGPAKPYRLITNAAGFELSPTLSPDASMLAYSASDSERREDGDATGSAILVQTTTSAPPRQLTHPGIGVRDDLPAWSPDGREIAFARWLPDGSCRILLVAAVGAGEEREVTRCDGSDLLSFDWSPDGTALVFGTMTGDSAGRGIRLLDPASGQWQALDYDMAAGSVDYRPRYSPDGKWIVFVRNPQLGDLWRIPAGGGPAEQLTRLGAEIRGWSWLDSGRRLVFGMRVDTQSRLYTFDIASGDMRDLGIDDAQGPTVSRRGEMMAFVHRNPEFGIYRVDPAGSDAPERVFASSGRDTQPTVSPDGRQLVFSSDRAGSFELWWADLASPESLRPIERIRPDTRQAPVWSDDSAQLLVAAVRDDDTPVIYEVTPATGAVDELPVPVERPRLALYAGGSTRLLVLDEQGGGTRLTLYDRSGADWRALAAIEGVSNARYDAARDKVLFTRLDSDGLWEIGATLQPSTARAIANVPSRWRYRSWALINGGVSYLHMGPGCHSQLSQLNVTRGEVSQPGCLAAQARNAVNGFSADPVSGVAYVALAEQDGTDIAFMPAPRPLGSRRTMFANWLNGLKKSDS